MQNAHQAEYASYTNSNAKLYSLKTVDTNAVGHAEHVRKGPMYRWTLVIVS